MIMATGSKGMMSMKNGKVSCEGPAGPVKGGAKSYDSSKGSMGMRQTYKQTGTPGKGSK